MASNLLCRWPNDFWSNCTGSVEETPPVPRVRTFYLALIWSRKPSQARHTRTVDGLGYLILQRYQLYAEEGLAGTKVAVWVAEDSLTVEYGGEAL